MDNKIKRRTYHSHDHCPVTQHDRDFVAVEINEMRHRRFRKNEISKKL